jgi:histidyl-tRNA synthetase
LKGYLDNLNIKYTVNDRIVRGLDYYTKTVFEFVSDDVGTQGTICGGGRYDGLVSQFGGGSVPGIGFAMGVERLIMLLSAEGTRSLKEKRPLLFIASAGDEARKYSSRLSCVLRAKDISCENDVMDRSLKAQMKFADKIGAVYVVVIGDEEIKSGIAELKDMQMGGTQNIRLDDIYNGLMKLEGTKCSMTSKE